MKKIVLYLALCLSVHLNALLVTNEPSLVVLEKPESNGHIEDIIPYGTVVKVTEEKEGWAHITYADYQGWVKKNSLLEVSEDPALHANAFVGYKGAYVFNEADTEWGPFLHLPFEVPVEVIKEPHEANNRWVIVKLQDGRLGYIQRSQLVFHRFTLTLPEMVQFSKRFIGIKYLWGGRTSFGYDCSGFVQMLYRQMGIILPRNSSRQAEDPQFVEVDKNQAQAGDLVFFKNSSGKIVHVGMMLDHDQFIHAFTKCESWITISHLSCSCWTNSHFYSGVIVKRWIPQIR